MTATAHIFPGLHDHAAEIAAQPVAVSYPKAVSTFVDDQLSSLVRQVFSPGWPRPARQVVFAPIDAAHEIGPLCLKIAETLLSHVPGTVCLIDATAASASGQAHLPSGTFEPRPDPDRRLVTTHLGMLAGVHAAPEFSAAWIHHRLSDLRHRFDYTIILAPSIGTCSETRLLAHLADGAVLVLNAHTTRRMPARRARDLLLAANVHLIGAVLDKQRFPIPDAIYRRL